MSIILYLLGDEVMWGFEVVKRMYLTLYVGIHYLLRKQGIPSNEPLIDPIPSADLKLIPLTEEITCRVF